MHEPPSRDEVEFINRIDAAFPHSQRSTALGLIAEAVRLGRHADFFVLHELARPPCSQLECLAAAVFLELLEHWYRAAPSSTQRRTGYSIAQRRLRSELIEDREILTTIRELATQPPNSALLDVLSFSASDAAEDEVERECAAVLRAWSISE